MPYVPDQLSNTGSFVQQTPIFDASRLLQVDVTSPEFKELLILLAQQTNNISLVLNQKVSGYYIDQEFATSAQYYNPNSNNPLELIPEFRSVYNTGALGAALTTIVPHGLTIGANWRFTAIYGTANDNVTPLYSPIPNGTVGGGDIAITVDGTNINIVNNTATNFTSSTVVLQYVKY